MTAADLVADLLRLDPTDPIVTRFVDRLDLDLDPDPETAKRQIVDAARLRVRAESSALRAKYPTTQAA